MSSFKRSGPPLAAACLLVLALTSAFWAQEAQVTEKHETKVLRAALKDVINQGAELFNKYGDHAGCYRLFQGALIAIKPFLAPPRQQEIDKALAYAESLPRYSDRAYELRKTIDSIRAQAATPSPVVPDQKTEVPGTTLWDRLGGEKNVRKVVDDFTQAAAADPMVNVSRNGKYKLDEPSVKYLEQQLVDFISTATGGPLKYQGKSMKDIHKGMGITNAEYDALGKHVKKALEQNGARPEDVNAVLKAVESLRPEIVEEKKRQIDLHLDCV
jgi:hemoglobin